MAEALATITEVQDLGMIQIRADLAQSGKAIAAAAGLAIPDQARITRHGSRALGWMAPDELLLMAPRADMPDLLSSLQAALQDDHALVVDVSQMRAVFDVVGAGAADTLAKLAPVDFAALPDDGLRRTRLAQIACGLWPVKGGYRVIGFRSVRDYISDLLAGASRPGSSLAPR